MTQDQFRDYVAQNLGVKKRGNALDADDAKIISKAITVAHAELEQVGIALWTIDDIPDYAVRAFDMYVRGGICNFGFDQNLVLIEAGEKALRYLTADPEHGVGKAEYF